MRRLNRYLRVGRMKYARVARHEAWLLPYLPPDGRIALDVGANVGQFSLDLAERFDQVHAFELNPQALDQLRAQAPDNVRVWDCAIG
jgi:2-polyprenyl-3-methyl-5-hydroxy-6-metoxy-1,4-benzoquinol methylase